MFPIGVLAKPRSHTNAVTTTTAPSLAPISVVSPQHPLTAPLAPPTQPVMAAQPSRVELILQKILTPAPAPATVLLQELAPTSPVIKTAHNTQPATAQILIATKVLQKTH